MILVAVIGLAFTANAQVVFRSTQSVCGRDGGQLIFKSNGTVEIWNDGIYAGQGTYNIESKIIIMTFDGGKMRLSAHHNGQTLYSVTFQSDTYSKCSR